MDASSKMKTLELFDVGPCCEPRELGFLVGRRFSDLIRRRAARDLVLQHQLLPFARTARSELLLGELAVNNRRRFPRYWDEMMGIAEGSGVPILDIMLLNFRKEILPFVSGVVAPAATDPSEDIVDDDCSDVLVVGDSIAVVAHNEDANLALVGHTYLIRAMLPNGLSFTAYTYAGELPSCAFGYNSHGLAFTLNSVPPSPVEIVAGGIGRNFVSRDLLEATGLEDALHRIRSCNASVGHSYNLADVRNRRILNVETASGNRVSIQEVRASPFFHANMYLHLQVQQVQDENSIARQRRAARLLSESNGEVLSVLGDFDHEKYPIYMTGPTLYTLCSVLINLDDRTLSIFEENPKNGEATYVLPI